MKYCSLLLTVLVLFSCSDDEPTAGCFQDEGRRIVTIVNNINGTVIFNGDCGYLIDPDERLDRNPTSVLFPCNLEIEFEIDGLKVNFSGFVYESFEFEDICADFFEITDIEIVPDNQ